VYAITRPFKLVIYGCRGDSHVKLDRFNYENKLLIFQSTLFTHVLSIVNTGLGIVLPWEKYSIKVFKWESEKP